MLLLLSYVSYENKNSLNNTTVTQKMPKDEKKYSKFFYFGDKSCLW